MTKKKPEESFSDLDINAQCARFFADGGKIQHIPNGVMKETMRDRRGMNEMTAKAALGGKKGSATRTAKYANLMARKPKKESYITISESDDD